MNQIQSYELDDFLAKVRPVWYGNDGADWDSVYQDMMADANEHRIITSLAAILRAGKKFNEPILFGYDDEADETMIWNGMHRICAHILTQTSPVIAEDGTTAATENETPDVADDEDDDYEWLETTAFFGSADIDQHLADTGMEEEELLDILFSFRSFPLDADGTRWADADLGSRNELGGMYKHSWGWSDTTPDDPQAISEALTRLIEDANLPAAFSITTERVKLTEAPPEKI